MLYHFLVLADSDVQRVARGAVSADGLKCIVICFVVRPSIPSCGKLTVQFAGKL